MDLTKNQSFFINSFLNCIRKIKIKIELVQCVSNKKYDFYVGYEGYEGDFKESFHKDYDFEDNYHGSDHYGGDRDTDYLDGSYGCSDGYCWGRRNCDRGRWCWTTSEYTSEQYNYRYETCRKNRQCDPEWDCSSPCRR